MQDNLNNDGPDITMAELKARLERLENIISGGLSIKEGENHCLTVVFNVGADDE